MLMILSFLISLAVSAAIGALILMLIAPFTAQRRPDFEDAFLAMFMAYLCQRLASPLLAFVLPDLDMQTLALVQLAVGILVLTVVLGYVIEATIPRAFLTAVVLSVLGIAVGYALSLAWAAIREPLAAP